MEAGPYKVWVAPVQATIEGTTLRLSTVSAFAARRLREQFEPLIRKPLPLFLNASLPP